MRYLTLIPVVLLLATSCDSQPKTTKNSVVQPSSETQQVEFPADHMIPEAAPSNTPVDTAPTEAPSQQPPAEAPNATSAPLSAAFVNEVPTDAAKPVDAVLVKEAFAIVTPTQGNSVTGKVTFTQEGDELYIVADFEGLKPGEHGFHIHEKGDCSAHDASSAGGHFNPSNKPHGGPNDEERHAGDLGNVVADEEGKAHYEFTDSVLSLNGPDSIVDKSVVVHADPDDLKSQPTGNSGARIGCGVIKAAE